MTSKTISINSKLFSNAKENATYFNFSQQVIDALSYTVNYNVKNATIETINDLIDYLNLQSVNFKN
jgi:hypothetical protein